MLCYRCGSHVQDGAEKCWNCGTVLTGRKDKPSTAELRARQRTGSRMFGVVYKIGDLVANRYRVKDIVGSGGAGVVYRARDQEIDVDVAVKVVNAKLVQTSDEQRLFSRQTKIAKKLSHQNVVRIYDEGRDEQRPYFTMQFLEGLSLRKIIDLRKEKKQTFALSEVEPIFNQLCQALDYSHKTTFHGNMKPDNVIVLPDLLKITDFALLRGLPRKPFLAIQKSRGTNFRYLAPEVRLEVPDLERSVDVYSLGVILCEMLTGLVYDEGKAEELNTAGSGLDPSVLRVLKRCLARAPKDRYRTTKDIYEDIRSAMTKAGGQHAVPPPPPAEQHPANAAEAETQRLDIGKHGARPVSDTPARPTPDADAPSKRPPPAPPVEVATNLDVSDEPPREGTASFEIDDDMIEASEAHKSGQASAEALAASPASAPPEPELGDPAAAIEDEELQDDPDSPGELDDEEPTQAVLDPAPDLAPIAAAVAVPSLEEISNSAIELIADPSATNVMRVDRERQSVEPMVSDPEAPPSNGAHAADQQTVQPTPLPDSAIPEPAFASAVSADRTEAGRLDEPPPPPVAVPVPPSPTAPSARPPVNGTGSGSDAPKRATKKRPMTRPRMSTIQPTAAPIVSTLPNEPGPASARPQTMPAAAGLGTIPPVPPPPAAPAQNNRPLYFTVAASVGAVILALLIVLKVSCDQQAASTKQIAALQQQMGQMQGLAKEARSNQQKFEAEAAAQGTEAAKAAEAEAEAEKAVAEEAKKKAEAEAEALRRAEEARAAEQAVRDAADKKARDEAQRRATEAKRLADERRADADEAARRGAAAKSRAEAERKKRERAQRAKRDKERRAKEEAAAARRAEERAERLAAEEQRRRERDDAAAERRAAAADARREAAAAKAAEEARKAEAAKAAEEARKKAAAEAKKAESSKALAATADTPAGGQKCPRGMVLVPAGSFMMGSARNDPERNFGDKSFSSVEMGAFCVDYYEYPNGRGLTPKTRVSYKTAASRCKKKGKRLCSEEEWEKACKGRAGTRYPYGNQWDPSRCNTEDDEGTDREVAKSGTFRKCYSGFRVFDMSGNVAEWTSTAWGSGYVVKGGAADRPGYDGRCAARKKKKSGTRDEGLGFRCCSDPE